MLNFGMMQFLWKMSCCCCKLKTHSIAIHFRWPDTHGIIMFAFISDIYTYLMEEMTAKVVFGMSICVFFGRCRFCCRFLLFNIRSENQVITVTKNATFFVIFFLVIINLKEKRSIKLTFKRCILIPNIRTYDGRRCFWCKIVSATK